MKAGQASFLKAGKVIGETGKVMLDGYAKLFDKGKLHLFALSVLTETFNAQLIPILYMGKGCH